MAASRGLGGAAGAVLLVLLAAAGPVCAQVLAARSLAEPLATPSLQMVFSPSEPLCCGRVDDASCDVEEVERANMEQLHSILQELMNTTYFRLFRVNLDRECPFWSKAEADSHSLCAADAAAAASTGVAGGMGPGSHSPFSAFGKEPASEGGACFLQAESSSENVHEASGLSNVAAGTSTSEDDKAKSSWVQAPMTDRVDRSTSRREDQAMKWAGLTCEDDDSGRPNFWLDMCRNIPTNTSQYVNLIKNPERWTGYNGSHVWAAIYSENCFQRANGNGLLGATSEDLSSLCYEERVLYRLLSGMHASTNIHIAAKYYPPRKGVRATWESNPERFMDLFAEHPERLKNLHFAFVVMLRALKRAAPFFHSSSFGTGDADEDSRTVMLVSRLLDSHIIHSCGSIFSAFDESTLFREGGTSQSGQPSSANLLKRQFKGVFQNISAILDCVSCQKCKLHGKLHLLGLGTALKILLLPEVLLPSAISHDEVVAFFNTLGKFSDAIVQARRLTHLFWSRHQEQTLQQQQHTPSPASASRSRSAADATTLLQSPSLVGAPARAAIGALGAGSPWSFPSPSISALSLVDAAVGAIAQMAAAGRIAPQHEDSLVDLALSANGALLVLARHYAERDPAAFVRHAVRQLTNGAHVLPPSEGRMEASRDNEVDAVVVGGGLAGLTASLSLLDRGARVVLVEKEPFLGGNSAWASSGINAVDPVTGDPRDSVEAYTRDTLLSAGSDGGNSSLETHPLTRVLTENSAKALAWLRDRVGLQFAQVGQMGGHRFARTYRPSEGMAGSKMVVTLQRLVQEYADKKGGGLLTIRKNSRVKSLLTEPAASSGSSLSSVHVVGVELESGERIWSRSGVVIATGGFASDRSNTSLLSQFRPDLANLPTTNGRWASGDGHRLALEVGAGTVDMTLVQVHPTSFIDPADPEAARKTLCAEILRGEGGILLDEHGHRFCNEMGTRDYIVQRMLDVAQQHPQQQAKFAIVLNDAAANATHSHLVLYQKKNLMVRLESLEDLARWMNFTPLEEGKQTLRRMLEDYNAAASGRGQDQHGRRYFVNAPIDPDKGPFYAGWVTPALHYCMGGLAVDGQGRVLRDSPSHDPIPGLYAIGEVTGGIHGNNRLGGNALTECVVFGRIVGEGMPLVSTTRRDDDPSSGVPSSPSPSLAVPGGERKVDAAELARHASEKDCWMALYGRVYDLTDFLPEHPGGAEPILEYAGRDGTEVFEAVHNKEMLNDFVPIGRM